jgi:hydroxyquinol 1,2-dioxygenase
MRDVTEENLIDVFVRSAADAPDVRARDLFVGLARHLLAFVCETRLTHAEWRAAIAGLARACKTTNAERNEFTLLSDMFGISSLVDLISSPAGATPSSVLGPFHQRGAPAMPNGGDLWKGQPGEVLLLSGDIVDAATGAQIPGATLDLWQNADNGFYSVQDSDQPDLNYHGMLSCDDDGSFAFTTTRFKPYAVPTDGVGGEVLRLLGRNAWRPAHLHVIVEAPGYRTITIELFLSDDPWLDCDAAFGVRKDLILDLASQTKADFPTEKLAAHDHMPDTFLVGSIRFRMIAEPKPS